MSHPSEFSGLHFGPGFLTASRCLRLWTDVASSEKPALFQYERDDIYTNGKNYLQIVEMSADLYIYIDAGKDQSIAPVTVRWTPWMRHRRPAKWVASCRIATSTARS